MGVREANGDGKMLRRVIAVLVALAVLAERSAARSWPVRGVVLWLLRRAETAARDFVLEETGAPAAAKPFVSVADGPDDALGLAARFRMLAAALAAMLPDARGLVDRRSPVGFAFCHFAPARARAPDGWRPRPTDTS